MKIKFYLESKTSDASPSTIWCYVREYDQTLTLNTGEQVRRAHWDPKQHRADPKTVKDKVTKGALISLNHYLNSFENKIIEIGRSVRGKDFGASFSKVADEIKKQFNKRETNFFSIFDEFLNIKRIEVSKQSIHKLRRIKSLLQEYQSTKNEKLNFEGISPLFFSKFFSYLVQEKNMLTNTANKNIRFLKTFLIWANNNGYSENTSYKTYRSKNEENEVIYLTYDELMMLYNFETENDKLVRVRDLFTFQCFTGVRYSDIKNIQREDILGPTWKVRTLKTHQIIEIPLPPQALAILAKYQEFPQPLPVISNQKANKYVKELCKEAGIDTPIKIVKYKGSERIEATMKKYEVIGTHTARRTFISVSLRRKMPPDVIMAITGHTTYRMMQRYLKIADEHKREEMDRVWGSPLRVIGNTK